MEYPSKEYMIQKVGENVVSLRKSAGISQNELSLQADIDLSTLSRIERGQLNGTFSTYYKIAKALNIPLVKIFE